MEDLESAYATVRDTARVLELVMAFAVIQVAFRDECAGAKVYHLLHRRRMAPASEQGVRT